MIFVHIEGNKGTYVNAKQIVTVQHRAGGGSYIFLRGEELGTPVDETPEEINQMIHDAQMPTLPDTSIISRELIWGFGLTLLLLLIIVVELIH